MRLYWLVAMLFLTLSAAPARAQAFNAGARSLGVGGGFTALADDATGVFWNPAGTANLGIQFHGTTNSYNRIDEKGSRDLEPTPGPAFIGGIYGLSSDDAIIGGYYTPFINERSYRITTGLPQGTSFREIRVEQFFNRLSLGYARVLPLAEEGLLTAIAMGGTLDLSITSLDGDYFDSNGLRDSLDSREVALGFTFGVLTTLVNSEKFELKLGGTFHHPGDFPLKKKGFSPLNSSATESRLYDWPLIASAGVAVRCLETKSLVFVIDYQFVGWREANRHLDDTNNLSLGSEYAFFVTKKHQLILRAGARRIEEASVRDSFSRGLNKQFINATLGLGLVYQPRTDAFYAVDFALEVGEEINFSLSLTLGF